MSALKFTDPSKTYVIADTHAFHKNICSGCTSWDSGADRPYSDPALMTKDMADIINKKVPRDGVLIHLGDWSFGGFDNIKIFRDMIECDNIYIILGNHDHHIAANKGGCRSCFTKVFGEEGVYCQVEICVGQHKYFCGHFKPAVWNKSHRNVRALWAHSHGSYPDKADELSFDAGWDVFGKPLSFVEVEEVFKKKSWKSVDHHK